MVTATFLTEDSYLGEITNPLTLNRYNYTLSNYLNYQDPSGHDAVTDIAKHICSLIKTWIDILNQTQNQEPEVPVIQDNTEEVVNDVISIMETYEIVNPAIMTIYHKNPKAVREAVAEAYLMNESTVLYCEEFNASNKIIKFMLIEEGTKNTKVIDGELWHFVYDSGAKDTPDWTLGYGTKVDSKDAYPNGISDAVAKQFFSTDVESVTDDLNDFIKNGGYITEISDEIPPLEMTQQQFDALVSLAYNANTAMYVADTGYEGTQRLVKDIGQGNSDGTELFGEEYWAGPKAESQGLVPRRKRELIIMQYGIYINKDATNLNDLFINDTEKK